MIELKVQKIGKSLGIVLPEEVLNRLQARIGSPLFLLEDPTGSYRLSPPDPGAEQKTPKPNGRIDRYRTTLHQLAK